MIRLASFAPYLIPLDRMKLKPMLIRQTFIAAIIAILAYSGAVQVTHPLVHIEKVHIEKVHLGFSGHYQVHDYLASQHQDHHHDHGKSKHDHLCQECVLANFSLATSFLFILSTPQWLSSSFQDAQYTRPSKQLIGESTIRGPPLSVLYRSE